MMRLFSLILVLWLCLMPAAAQDTQQPNAAVQQMSATLNLRETPTQQGAVIVELAGGTPLIVLGRTSGNGWLNVRTLEGLTGWVAAGYVDLGVDLASLPIITPPVVASATAVPSETQAPSSRPDATVKALSLNLRAAPSTRATILLQLPNRTPLTLIGRSADNAWLQAQTTDGVVGWVAAAYLQVNIVVSKLPIVNVTTTTTTIPNTATPISTSVISNITAQAKVIFQRGQTLGNRANVFAKVGDSITVTTDMYDPLGRGYYTLGDYAYLQGVIEFYTTTIARNQNSFANTSVAAGSGWTTQTVFDPTAANTAVCSAGETPLDCEYRTTMPAVALIMLGSNDVQYFDAGTYQANLQRITQTTIDRGIIPVLSTIPVRVGYGEQVDQFNAIIRDTAFAYQVPLWDYHAALAGLPNSGLSGDGLHPSTSPEGYAGAAKFTGDNLQYGYVMRNLTALQVLDALWRQVLN